MPIDRVLIGDLESDAVTNLGLQAPVVDPRHRLRRHAHGVGPSRAGRAAADHPADRRRGAVQPLGGLGLDHDQPHPAAGRPGGLRLRLAAQVYGNFDMIFEPFLAQFSASPAPRTRAIFYERSMLTS